MPPGRPPKQRTPPPDRVITLYLHHYLERQNEIAESLRSYQQMANGLLSFASQQVGTLSNALSGLQQGTRNVLEANGLDPSDEKLEAFAALAPILKMDKNELARSLSLASTDLAALALKQQKKQKKPRKPRDPNAPQRPHTAFFLFQAANREQFRNDMREKDPDVKPGQVQSRLTEAWNQMSPDQQQPYKDKYQHQNEAYNKAKTEYEATHGKFGEEPADGELSVTDALGGAGHIPVEDASGDAETSDDDESSEDDKDSESSSEATPSPPPKKSKDKDKKKHKSSTSQKPASPEKRKRKHERVEHDDDTPKKRKKNKGDDDRDGKKEKKKSRDSNNIDPELTRLDKEQKKEKKEKHLEGYAPAQQPYASQSFPSNGFPPQSYQRQGFPVMAAGPQTWNYQHQRPGV